jgi:uncharacterized protein YcsI (UPF0317 family)
MSYPIVIAQQHQQRQYQNYPPSLFRQLVRENLHFGPTNGICIGYMQCHMVVMDLSLAMNFITFCQRNHQSCPMLEICVDDENSRSYMPTELAPSGNVDLRTDIPKYSIYRDGLWERDIANATSVWPENAVSFLIGSSFSYDGAFIDAGIPLRSVDANKNVPYYTTNIPCQSAGPFSGNVVVSMKPIPCTMVSEEVLITQEYPYIHGTPICIGGDGRTIGIANLNAPDFGEAIVFDPNQDVPVFHESGMTIHQVIMTSKIPFAITSAVGCMFITDRPTPDYL